MQPPARTYQNVAEERGKDQAFYPSLSVWDFYEERIRKLSVFASKVLEKIISTEYVRYNIIFFSFDCDTPSHPFLLYLHRPHPRQRRRTFSSFYRLSSSSFFFGLSGLSLFVVSVFFFLPVSSFSRGSGFMAEESLSPRGSCSYSSSSFFPSARAFAFPDFQWRGFPTRGGGRRRGGGFTHCSDGEVAGGSCGDVGDGGEGGGGIGRRREGSSRIAAVEAGRSDNM